MRSVGRLRAAAVLLSLAVAAGGCGSSAPAGDAGSSSEVKNVSVVTQEELATQADAAVASNVPTAEEVSKASASETAETESSAGEKAIEAVLYLPDEDAAGFTGERVELAEDTPEALLAALEERGAVPKGSKVLSFINDGSRGILDLSAEFGKGMRTTGTAGEYLYMGSLADTFIMYYDLEELSVTVEGKILETGHNIYDSDLIFME